MANVWHPLPNPQVQASLNQYTKELRDYAMVPAVILYHKHQDKSIDQVRQMLQTYNIGLSSLNWSRRESYLFGGSDDETTFVEESLMEHNPDSFIGASGGWLYNVSRDCVEMFRPSSLRTGIPVQARRLRYSFQVVAFAVEHSTGLTAALQCNFPTGTGSPAATLHIRNPSRKEWGTRTYSWPVFWTASVKPIQFTIVGDFVAMIMTYLVGPQGGQQTWVRSKFIVVNWKRGTVAYEMAWIESFQFITTDSLLLLTLSSPDLGHPPSLDPNAPVSPKVYQVLLGYGRPNQHRRLNDVTAHGQLTYKMLKGVAFVPRAESPVGPIQPRDPNAQNHTGYDPYDTEFPPDPNGPFHADHREQIIGIIFDIKLQYYPIITPFFLLFNQGRFMAPRGSPPAAGYAVVGLSPHVHGTRAFWWLPALAAGGPATVQVQDFNPRSIALYGTGTRGTVNSHHPRFVPHARTSDWMMDTWAEERPPLQNGQDLFGTRTFLASAEDRDPDALAVHFYVTEDNIIIIEEDEDGQKEAWQYSF